MSMWQKLFSKFKSNYPHADSVWPYTWRFAIACLSLRNCVTSLKKEAKWENLIGDVRKSHILRHYCFSVLRLGVISLTIWLCAYNLHILKLMTVILKLYYSYYPVLLKYNYARLYYVKHHLRNKIQTKNLRESHYRFYTNKNLYSTLK